MNWPPYLILTAISFAWCGAILAVPWMFQAGHLGPALFISLFFSMICHQDPSRSFSLLSMPMPVCTRCESIYLGWLTGIALFPLTRTVLAVSPRLRLLPFVATLLLFLDVFLDLVGIWKNTVLSRSLTGAFFGISCGLTVARVTQRICREPVSFVR